MSARELTHVGLALLQRELERDWSCTTTTVDGSGWVDGVVESVAQVVTVAFCDSPYWHGGGMNSKPMPYERLCDRGSLWERRTAELEQLCNRIQVRYRPLERVAQCLASVERQNKPSWSVIQPADVNQILADSKIDDPRTSPGVRIAAVAAIQLYSLVLHAVQYAGLLRRVPHSPRCRPERLADMSEVTRILSSAIPISPEAKAVATAADSSLGSLEAFDVLHNALTLARRAHIESQLDSVAESFTSIAVDTIVQMTAMDDSGISEECITRRGWTETRADDVRVTGGSRRVLYPTRPPKVCESAVADLYCLKSLGSRMNQLVSPKLNKRPTFE